MWRFHYIEKVTGSNQLQTSASDSRQKSSQRPRVPECIRDSRRLGSIKLIKVPECSDTSPSSRAAPTAFHLSGVRREQRASYEMFLKMDDDTSAGESEARTSHSAPLVAGCSI
ncbi:unnamed protein product, partial [Pleuronectes platessa]